MYQKRFSGPTGTMIKVLFSTISIPHISYRHNAARVKKQITIYQSLKGLSAGKDIIMYNTYIPNTNNISAIFGTATPVCMNAPALQIYAQEHDLNPELLRYQFRIADQEDIDRWGTVAEGMKAEDFQTLWIAAQDTHTKEAYVAETGVGRIWCDIDGCDPVPNARIEFLEHMWDAAHMPLDGFAAEAHMTIGDLGRFLAIDRQTFLDWRDNAGNIPEYARIMMARALRILPTIMNNSFDPNLTPQDFWCLWVNAVETHRKDHYICDNGMSYVWPDNNDNLDARVAYLERLWDTAHMNMDAFASASGVSIGDLCRLMGIDRQSLLAWSADSGTIPEYIRVMLSRAIGMI